MTMYGDYNGSKSYTQETCSIVSREPGWVYF